MNPTNATKPELTPASTEELAQIEGGTDWCGTGLPNHGMPQYPQPVQRDIFGDVVKRGA
jgi:hypothetical protein